MKDDQLCVFGGVVCPETYLGTRMNQKALLFHTQLHEWSDAQRLSQNATGHTRMVNSARERQVCLPIKKLSQIEYWTRDVNKYYHPKRPVTAKSGSFMYIDVSKYNIKDTDKSELLRPKTAFVRSSRPSQRPVSAITTNSIPKRRFFGTDLNTIANQLVESQFHYTALRKNLYSSKSFGKNNATDSVDGKGSLKNSESPIGFSTGAYDSEITSTLDNSAQSKASGLESQGHDLVPQQNMQPVITSRSWSNKMLNVISIDDCKLTCRYRPQKIKEARGPATDYEELDRKKNKAKKKDKKTKTEIKNCNEDHSESHADADDENESEVDINMNTIHLSPDRNNNETIHQIIVTEPTPCNDDSDSDIQYLPNTGATNTNSAGEEQNNKPNSFDETDEVFEDVIASKADKEKAALKSQDIELANEEIRDIMNSRGTSKTSYGRITTLYPNSVSTKQSKPEKKKKVTRTQRINHAIDDMICERKVMNSMTKDFDKRIAEFGRTTIDKQDGSETFKKMHSNLRRKIDQFMEYKGAMKTRQFHEKRRLNSSSTHGSVEKL